MGAFGSISLGNKFGIILGALVAVAFIAGLVKLWINKRRLRNHIKLADQESTRHPVDKEKQHERQLGPGDLFGVRALEHGHFGGVAQSRPSSPAASYVLSPRTNLTNWGEHGTTSASSSVTDLGKSHISDPALPAGTATASRKPSPLKIEPSPGVQSGLNTETESTTNGPAKGWVSPLDIHFSRPTTPNSRPKSYLPRMQFAGLEVRTSEDIFGGPVGAPTASIKEAVAAKSSSYSAFPPPPIPLRSQRETNRSLCPLGNDTEMPISNRTIGTSSLSAIPLPPVPATLKPEGRVMDSEAPIIPSQNGTPALQATRFRTTSQQSIRTKRDRAASAAASSVYSATTSILDYNTETEQRGRNTSPSQVSSKSLSRTRDSLRRHDRTTSRDQSLEKRRSHDRDQLHFDPSAHNRNRSGSIQGRAIDFSRPRESPFSHSARAPTHSNSSSFSTASTASNHRTTVNGVSIKMGPILTSQTMEPRTKAIDVDRLGAGDLARDRRSTQSRASLGDFYDSYYTNSAVVKRSIHEYGFGSSGVRS